MIQKNIKNKYAGFTIVETLVAIAVLMIAIAGPLVIASKGLTAALYSKDQMVASFLAQESMEVIKNLRDNALKSNNSGGWLALITCNSSNKDCDADPFVYGMQNSCSSYSDGCPIYYDQYTGYTSQFASQSTVFRRYFYLEDVDSDPDQKIAHVVVKWEVGTIPFETELISLITNAER